MAGVYSYVLFSDPDVAGGGVPIPPQPDGSTMIIRDVDSFNAQGYSVPLSGWVIYDSSGGPIAAPDTAFMHGQRNYPWRGRQIVESGDTATVFTLDTGWQIRVSGYILTP